MFKDKPEIMTAEEAAKALRISTRTLTRWHKNGYGPPRLFVKPGARILYARDVIDNWVRENSVLRCQPS